MTGCRNAPEKSRFFRKSRQPWQLLVYVGSARQVLYLWCAGQASTALKPEDDMNQEHLEARLEEIQHLLSHLHGAYSEVLLALRRIEGNADLDDLTGLLRRRSFAKKWEVLLGECQDSGEDCSVLMIDIDHFKRINDTQGHPAGDEVIKRIASLLKQYESPACIAGRFGGEEFVLAIRGTEKEALGVAELIRRRAERLHDGELKCTLSVGVASARQVGFDAPRLLKAADTAMYSAKNSGRNRVRRAA
jgi:diguanylate cyclase (GGDEF)-like protein